MARFKIFRGIGELVTLEGAAFKEGRHVTEKDLSVIEKGAFISEGGKIIWVGKESQLTSSLRKKLSVTKEKEINLQADTVMPGFVECHTHSIFAGDRTQEFEWRVGGMTYQEIAQRGGGILSTVQATRQTSEARLFKLTQERVNGFIGQGVTTLELKSGYGLDQKTEIKMLRVARQISRPRTVVTFLGAHAIPKEFDGNSEAYLDELIKKVLPQVAKHRLADRVDMFIEANYFSSEQAQKYFAAATRLGFAITAHVEQLSHQGGSQVAVGHSAQSVDHLVEARPDDIGRLAKSSTTAVLLPASDLYLRMKYPPARALIDAGARVALATDFNPGTCPTQDLSLVGLLARLEMRMTLPEVISAYTLGAAHALGWGDQLGAIVKGKSCDFITLKCSWRDLFYSVGVHPVDRVWLKGQLIHRT